ncbi:MAG: carbohydrate kinase family protein [Candidatus Nomurabacteria bacterium]|nr:carbohydrate kinase family protein [Candidatus Nomurabacteria bacterium]
MSESGGKISGDEQATLVRREPWQMKIVCLGAAMQDVFLPNAAVKMADGTVRLPIRSGEKMNIPEAVVTLGGGATNAAATFAKCGYSTLYWGSVGLDNGSEFVGEVLIREGIDIAYMHYDEKKPTGLSVIFLDKKGERTILSARGAGADFNALDVAMLETERPDWLYMAGVGGNFRKIREVVAGCAEARTQIFWNPSGAELAQPNEVKAILPKVTAVMLNREEAEKVWGSREYVKIFRASLCPPILLITDGQAGSVVRQMLPSGKQKVVRSQIYEEQVVDRTGAGDAFGSGFLAHFALHNDLEAAIKFASANSARVVQHIGGREAVLGLSVRLGELPMVSRTI